MTSQNTEKEFYYQPQITIQMQLTPEEGAALEEWSKSVPTLYFLDICVVSATKISEDALEKDLRKKKLLNRLRDLDRSQNSFSYLFALIEKVSDSRGRLSDSELERQVLADVTALRVFFKNAHVQETDDFLILYLRDLRRVPAELMRPNYLKFLGTINNQFALQNSVSPMIRFQKAEEILKKADDLSITRQHPVVLLTLACLYGNTSAKKLMKFKADAEKFNAENALADIMAISRFACLKLELEHSGRQGIINYLRSEFITDDDGLLGVFRCFEPKAVKFEEGSDSCKIEINISVNMEQLLTDIFTGGREESKGLGKKNMSKGEDNEYERLCNLLIQAPAND